MAYRYFGETHAELHEACRQGDSHHHDDENSVRRVTAGYGSCGVGGCACQSFMGTGNLCANCGHHYDFH